MGAGAGIEVNETPLSTLAFVEELCAGVGPGVIGVREVMPDRIARPLCHSFKTDLAGESW